jgi:hypothetical protein
LEVAYATFPRSESFGFHGFTQDLKTGKWYAIYGKECDIPGCRCDAWVDAIGASDVPSDRDAHSTASLEEARRILAKVPGLAQAVIDEREER